MRNHEPSRRWVGRPLAVLLALGLVAAACGDSDSDGAAEPDGGTGGSSTTGAPPDEGSEGSEGEPVHGGTLVYGLEADTANPWAPYRASLATSGLVVLAVVSDPLLLPNADAEIQPNLAESFEANDDYTEWTFTIRDGITFHDGTPLDGDAVKFNMESCVGSPLAGPAYGNIDSVAASGQTVTVTAKTPWVALPSYFAGGSCSFMFSKQWLSSLADIPHRTEGGRFYDAALAATPADGDPAAPVGVGAFRFQSYTPGNGNSFIAVRNEDYWRGPNGITGEELPYLDSIELVPAVDVESRSNGLRSGQFDAIHTANADEIARFQEEDGFELIAGNDFGETSHIILNSANGENPALGVPLDPEGTNAASPLIHKPCRRALAHAMDRDRLAQERGAGIVSAANGPFPPGSMGHLEDSGFPEYDVAKANEEMDACLAETGTTSITFTYNTTNDPFNVESNELVISMWEEALGDRIDVSVTPIEQGQYIGLLLTGNFNANSARSHGGIDPDQQRLWWVPETASPIGSLALNFGRFIDLEMKEQLDIIRTEPDPDVRREATEEVNRLFGENVWNLWMWWTLWGIASHPSVNGVIEDTLPDGDERLGLVSGRHPMAQLWCDGGSCG